MGMGRVTDAIRNTGLGDRRRFPWRGRWSPAVESVVLAVWCKPVLTIGEAVGIFLVGFGCGRGFG